MKNTRARARKDSENSENSVKSDNSTKRTRESPEVSYDTPQSLIKVQRKSNKNNIEKTMGDQTQLSQQMQLIIAQVSKIDTLLESVKAIQDDVKKLSERQIESDKKLLKVERRVTKMEKEIEVLKSHNNELSQNSLSRDFVIFGLPFFEKSDNDKIISKLAKETGVQFDSSDLQSFYASRTAKNKKKCVVHGRFYSEKLKSKLISGSRKKDPIVVEDIIELQPDDPIHGTQVYIRSQLTSENRELANEARRQRSNGKLKFVWEKDGRILARKTESSSILQLRSMNQLMQIIAEPLQYTNTRNLSKEGPDSDSSTDMQP